ncbi:MAG: ABC transporter ATP-binding protein [Bacteroidales bacterium]|nr:ABC transporter ATP-binding protein [Bacteroidales bacterium]
MKQIIERIKDYWQYMWRLSEGFHRAAVLRTLLGVVRVGVVLTFIWLSKTAIDCATGKPLTSEVSLTGWFAMMVVCILTDMVLAQSVKFIETRTILRMNNGINRRLYNVLMRMPLVNGRQGFHSGDMLNRLTVDAKDVATFALSELPTVVVLMVQLLGAFVFLSWLNPYLALAPVVVMPICILGSKLYFRRQRRLTAELRQAESDMQISIQEGLKHRIVLKSLECMEELDNRLRTILDVLDVTNREQARLSAASGSMVRLGFIIGYLTAFGWSIFSLKAGIISFGTMTAFIQLVSRIQQPIAGLASYLPTFITVSVGLDRLREIDVELQHDDRVGRCDITPHAGVRVTNLSFKYESDSSEVLSGFSHDFVPGSRTMIVGQTGAGKTTLIKLLLGLLKPDSGSVELYGGGECRTVTASTLCNFVYVPQGNSLMHGSIRDNLLLAKPLATDKELAEALHTAVADFVWELPQGLDTSCDEAGGGISEGQAQRIAIARALLRPGKILVLDEFNSSLDVDTAATLMRRISEKCADSTIIIIAHHRSAITPYCDTVLNIEANM